MTDADTTPPAAASAPRKRSPNFPGISLPKAIERARKMYDKTHQHPVPHSKIVVDYWGYKTANTGPATITYAALKRYGLLEDEGQNEERVAHLTDLAVEVLHANPNQEAAIQKAALLPDLFREWWKKYGSDIPPDDALHWEYVVKGPFAEEGFNTFLRVYRETIAFAKLDQAVILDPDEDPDPDPDPEEDGDEDNEDSQDGNRRDDEDSEPEQSDRNRQRKARREREQRPGVVSISLPLPAFGPDEPVVIEFPGKLREKDWTYFMAVIGAMKDGVVEDESTDD